jgi:hypothetical protein
MCLIHINKPFPPTERIHSNFRQFGARAAAQTEKALQKQGSVPV